MENGEHLSLEQVQAFLTGNEEIGFKASNRKELYEWTQRTLSAQSYSRLQRSGKGLMKRYIGRVTGLSRAQVTGLIGQYAESWIVRSRQGRGRRFTARYKPGDIALLAEVDEAHDKLSGPATQRILYRQYHEFADAGPLRWRSAPRRSNSPTEQTRLLGASPLRLRTFAQSGDAHFQ
jgi:hypothetical protein